MHSPLVFVTILCIDLEKSVPLHSSCTEVFVFELHSCCAFGNLPLIFTCSNIFTYSVVHTCSFAFTFCFYSPYLNLCIVFTYCFVFISGVEVT